MEESVLRFREFVRAVGRGEKRARALSFDDARAAMGMILDGQTDPEQRGAFLLACRIKGEDPVELAGFVAAMRDRCVKLNSPPLPHMVSVGHPYDGREDTFIMGAGAAIVAAAAGAKVVLHGAPQVPAKHAPGIAEVFQQLGIRAYLSPDEAPAFLSKNGFAHLDTRKLLPAWNSQLEIREKIGLRLPFSSAEKLLDPFSCGNLIVGIAHGPYLAKVGGAFKALNARGLVVQGLEGSCDLSPEHPARVAETSGDDIREISVDPKALGVSKALDIRAVGADPAKSAALIHAALERNTGDEPEGAAQAIALNAAILLWRAGIAADPADGFQKAQASITSGAAKDRLQICSLA
jgi:anthranilate phosphoribosyltransferase